MNNPTTKHFKFQLKELEISIEHIEKLAKIDDSMPEYSSFLEKEIATNLSFSQIEGGYRVLPALINGEMLTVGDYNFNTGTAIAKKFMHSTHIVVFTCTAGQMISDRLQELNAEGLILEAYLIDVLGSVIVEKAMDKMQDELEMECAEKGLNITNRYSPGYNKWSVEEQGSLFALLPKDFCGIQLSESSLMSPAKSISGFIGIGEKVRFQKHECASCNSVNCLYRNSKNHC